MIPTLIVELGVAEAYAILRGLGVVDLPPLDAIEHEDWGRDSLLGRFESFAPEFLASLGLTRDEWWDRDSASPGTDHAGEAEVRLVILDQIKSEARFDRDRECQAEAQAGTHPLVERPEG